MIIANFCKGDTTKILYGLWQWDYGQVLRIQGLDLPTATEIHFSLQNRGGEAVTRIGTTKDGITDVTIPDSMLENSSSAADYVIYAFVYLTDETSGQTEYKISIQVKARPRPEAFDTPEDTELFREAIQQVNDSADRAEAAKKAAEGYANEANKDAEETAANRKEVERLVESVSGIGEDVKLVADYKQAAQTAAQDADTSAKAAQTAQTAAETAKEAAETAQRAAETAAKNTSEDKTAVEQAKADVWTMQSQVAQDKTDVEQTKASFELTAQQAVADVNNAGQTQTDRVEDTGGAAVQEVNAAKTQAVQAVNSAGAAQVQTVNDEGDTQVSRVQEAAQEIVSDREQIQQNAQDITDIQQELVLKAPAIIQSVSGNPAIVQDFAEASVQNLTMQGWTEQKKTTGKNLFDMSKKQIGYPSTVVGDVFTLSQTTNINFATWESDCIAKAGETVVYRVDSDVLVRTRIVVVDENEIVVYQYNDTSPGLFSEYVLTVPDNAKKIYICVIDNNAYENDNIMIQVEYGDTFTSYEPYTGGAPSPSPDYPQEIVSAGDYNEETDKYEYEIKVTGKNILSIPDITPSTPERTIACNITRDITISAQEVPISISSNIWRLRMKYLDGTLLYFADVDFLSLKPKTFYASEENPIIAITYRETYITEGRYGGVQVEYGTSATEYQPFTEQTITLTSDRPLTEWDRLEKRDGVWGWVYGSDIVEFDGSEDEAWVFSNTYGGMFYTKKYDAVKGKAYCDKYMYVGAVSDEFSTGIFSIGLGVYPNSIWLKNVDIPNIQTLKSTLAENPITMVYQTSTEAFVPLTETEQAALNALHTNYPTTVLSNEQDCDMSLTYIADATNYINKAIQEAIQASIANNLLSANSTQVLSAKMGAELNSRIEALEE